jgi:hypothetical protein
MSAAQRPACAARKVRTMGRQLRRVGPESSSPAVHVTAAETGVARTIPNIPASRDWIPHPSPTAITKSISGPQRMPAPYSMIRSILPRGRGARNRLRVSHSTILQAMAPRTTETASPEATNSIIVQVRRTVWRSAAPRKRRQCCNTLFDGSSLRQEKLTQADLPSTGLQP